MWLKLDDQTPDHPKVAALSDAAFRLWVRGLCYCAANLTDGRIPTDAAEGWAFSQARRSGGAVEWDALIDELSTTLDGQENPLWLRVDGCYAIHDFLDFNPPAERVRRDRRQARQRMRKGRSPERSPEHDPERSPERSPEQVPERSPERSPEQVPERSGGCSPERSPPPVPVPVRSPVRTPVPPKKAAGSEQDAPARSAPSGAAGPPSGLDLGVPDDWGAVVWSAFCGVTGSRRSRLGRDERAQLAEWHRLGLDASAIADVIWSVGARPKAPLRIGRLGYFRDAVDEAAGESGGLFAGDCELVDEGYRELTLEGCDRLAGWLPDNRQPRVRAAMEAIRRLPALEVLINRINAASEQAAEQLEGGR